MMLNLYILRDDLQEWNLKEHLVTDRLNASLRRARLCRKLPDKLSDDILYIIESGSLNDLPMGIEGISILCSGSPSMEWLTAPVNILYTVVPFDLEDMMNRVCEIFDYYQNWEISLQDLVDRHRPLIEFAEKSFEIFGNALFCQGSGFRVLFMYLPENAPETRLTKIYRDLIISSDSIMSAEDINELISDHEFQEASKALEPQIYSGKLYGFRSLFFNILDENISIARITVDEIIRPIHDKDFVLIKVFGTYIRKALISNYAIVNSSFNQPANLDYVLKGLLSHTLLPETEIMDVLNNYRWNVNDTYFCIVMQLKLKGNCSSALSPLALEISGILKQDCYSITGKNIIYVINLTTMKRTRQDVLESIKTFLRDNLLNASSSIEFTDFKELYYYYQQASEIMRIGSLTNPTLWYYKFEDFQFEYLLDKYKYKTQIESLIPPGLKRLRKYDRKKGTDFMSLLKLYLDKERNVADTIRTAYIHRNTFLYRIHRIEEIINMDLNDPKTRIILQLSFSLLETHDNVKQ